MKLQTHFFTDDSQAMCFVTHLMLQLKNCSISEATIESSILSDVNSQTIDLVKQNLNSLLMDGMESVPGTQTNPSCQAFRD